MVSSPSSSAGHRSKKKPCSRAWLRNSRHQRCVSTEDTGGGASLSYCANEN